MFCQDGLGRCLKTDKKPDCSTNLLLDLLSVSAHIRVLHSQVVELACKPSGHSVIVKCIKTSSDQHQLVLIENICKEDTAMVRLARDQYGHMVVLTMLEVSRQADP
jgi:hypothetical protein